MNRADVPAFSNQAEIVPEPQTLTAPQDSSEGNSFVVTDKAPSEAQYKEKILKVTPALLPNQGLLVLFIKLRY